MKKQQIYSILLVLIIILILPLFNQLLGSSNTPFKNLKVEDVKSIDLYLQPPNEGITITNEETIKNIIYELNKVTLETEESPNIDYSSQLVTYTINKNSDESVEIKIYSPYILIDEKIYKANYQICDILNILGNDLLEKSK